MAKMGYQEAANIRKTGLSNLIANRLVEGEGIGSSFTKSISERTKANVAGLKQKVDYLNIAKKMFGGSNLAPALLGRLTGRNADSIRFFAGKGSAKPVSDKATKIEGSQQLEQTEAIYETLDNIYGFLKDSNDEAQSKMTEEQGKLEEKEMERKRRHDELLKLLGYKPETPTATKVVKEEKSFLDNLLDFFDTANLKKLATMLATRAPILSYLLGLYLASNFLKETGYGDRMALNEGKIAEKAFKEKLTDFSKLPLKQDEAKAILEQPEGPARERDIASFGGIDRIKAIAEGKPDPGGVAPKQKTYAEQQYEVAPPTVTPKAEFKIRNKTKEAAAIEWDKRYGKLYNEDGTKKSLQQLQDSGVLPKVKQPEVPAEENKPTSATPVPTTETAAPVAETPASAPVAQKTSENLDLQLPKPVVDSAKQVINSTTVNSQDTSQVAILPMPSVRNQEPTFQDMILYSTRVV